MATTRELLDAGIDRLRAAGSESPRLDAQLLLAHVNGVDRTAIVAHPELPVGTGPEAAFEALLVRREAGEPVAYLRGIKEFHGLAFAVDSRALIPRPETERLVDLALEEVMRRLASGEEFEVPLVDNVFAVALSRAKLPARLAAYDDAGAVIGLTDPIGDLAGPSAGPTRGKAVSLLKAESPLGSSAELLVSPSTAGGECMFIRYKGKPATGTMTSCAEPDWRRYPVMLNTYGNPGEFVMGRVRPDLERVEIGYADGAKTSVTPTRGYVLYEIPAEHIAKGKEALTATGYDREGKRVATWSFRPPQEGG